MKRGIMPPGHSFTDFEAFGPVATKDGELAGNSIFDLGCFSQGSIDSDKDYVGLIAKSKINPSEYYEYTEWGRVNGHKDFQFEGPFTEQQARASLIKTIESKTIKRGVWVDLPGLGKVLRPKDDKKGCYLIQAKRTRSCKIVCAQNICNDEAPKAASISVTTDTKKKTAKKKSTDVHPQVLSLLSDLSIGAITYTKSSLATGDVPSQTAIDSGKAILTEAVKHLNDDKTLRELSEVLYSKIPLRKTGKDWILSAQNIKLWLDDLDAFESCIGQDTSTQATVPVHEFSILDYVEKNSDEFKHIQHFMDNATRNRHSYLSGKMDIINIFKIQNPERIAKYNKYVDGVNGSPDKFERPYIFHQENIHHSIYVPETKTKNKCLFFHGTRSCNASGILKSRKLFLPRALRGVSINGALYGPGIYFADDWKKSAGYCSLTNGLYTSGSGGIKNRNAFMFLVDVCIGNVKTENRPTSYNSAPAGYHSVMGKAGTNVQNNEFIVYDEDANNLTYLLEFRH